MKSIEFSNISRVASCLALLCLSGAVALGDSRIEFGGVPDELTISQVSDHTVKIALTPLDEAGQPRVKPPVQGFVPFSTTEKLRVRELSGAKSVNAGTLRVTVQAEPLTILVRRSDGSLVQELRFDNEGGSNAVVFPMAGPLLGLGEGGPQFNRRDYTNIYRMQNGESSPLLATDGAQILVPYLIGTEGWAMFVAQPRVEFDLRGTNGAVRFRPPPSTNAAAAGGAGRGRGNRGGTAESATNGVELYVVDARVPEDAMKEYVRLTGTAAMPPKWALGYMQSHRTLGTEADILAEAKRFRDDKLPVDTVIYLGTGFCTNGWNVGHNSFQFNPNVFTDDAKTAIKKLHDENLHVVLHVTPLPETNYPSLHGQIPPAPGEILDKQDIGSYWARHEELFADGIDGWWPDEGDWFDVPSRLERLKMYYEGPLSSRPNVRPWDLERNGYAGMSKFGGWYWSGDITSTWHTLSEQVKVGVNTSLSLSPFWGTDIGGFYPDRSREYTGELYARWFEYAAFCPLFRSHGRTWQLHLPWGWNTGKTGPVESPPTPDPAELHNAAVEPVCQKYDDLRYQLLPYNYTLTREACDTGMPMIRALWLQYPQDTKAAATGDEFLWGANMLIAPVVERAATSRHLYLPAGSWYDWWTGEKVEGQQEINRPVDLATMPIYVRAGGIVPMDPVRQYTDEAVSGPTTLQVYPGANGTFVLYDDDGNSLGYSNGTDAKTVWIKMSWNDAAHRLTLEPDARMKKWPGGTRVFAAKIMGGTTAPKEIKFAGKSVTTQF